jgi:hypothetical protein
MAARVIIALLMAIAFVGWILFQLLIRKKRGADINNEVMFVAFFIAVWVGLTLLFW